MIRLTLFLLLFTLSVNADSNSTLENVRFILTNYYHSFLKNIDNSVDCEKNCTHPEIQKIKKNSLRLITSVKTGKNKNMAVSLNVRGHIDLPKISKKFRLTFSKQSADSLTNRQIDREYENLITDDKFRIGLKYIFMEDHNFEFFTKLSFRVHKPYGFYQKLSAKRIFTLYKDFSLRTQASLYYYINYRYFAKSIEFNFVKPLTTVFLLSQANDLDFNADNKHEKKLVNHLKLHHHVSHTDHLVYWLSYASLAKHDDIYKQDWQAVSISYIHNLSKWFYIQFIPRIIQKRENRFHTEYEATLSFGMILGK